MSQQYWWILAEQGQQIVAARVAEADHARLVRLAGEPERPLRTVVAGALRGIAKRLDPPRPADERQLAAAAR